MNWRRGIVRTSTYELTGVGGGETVQPFTPVKARVYYLPFQVQNSIRATITRV